MKRISLIKKISTFFNRKGFFSSLRRVTLFSGVGFVAQLVMMVYAIIVARALGPVQLGIYSGLYAIMGISITFVNFGLDQWMLKNAHTHNSIQVLTGNILKIKLILAAMWGILCLIILPLTQSQYFSHILVLLAITDITCDILFNSISISWTIQRKMAHYNFMLLFSRLGKFVLLLVLIALTKLTPIIVIISRVIISFLTFIISFSFFKSIKHRSSLKELISILKNSAVFGFSEILAMFYANIDVAILTFFSISDTGLYSPASGIIHALFIIPNSFYIYLIPKYSKQVSEKRDVFLPRKVMRNVLLIFSCIGIIISIALLVGGKFVISFVLGEKYIVTGDLIRILSPIMLFKSIAYGLALLIVITGNQKKRLLPQLIVSIFNITSNIFLLSHFGVFSMAWIYAISELLLMIGYLILVLKINRNENTQKEA